MTKAKVDLIPYILWNKGGHHFSSGSSADPKNSVMGDLTPLYFYVINVFHRELQGPPSRGSNCFSRVSVQVFLKPIVTCDFPLGGGGGGGWNPVPPPLYLSMRSSSQLILWTHESTLVFVMQDYIAKMLKRYLIIEIQSRMLNYRE